MLAFHCQGILGFGDFAHGECTERHTVASRQCPNLQTQQCPASPRPSNCKPPAEEARLGAGELADAEKARGPLGSGRAYAPVAPMSRSLFYKLGQGFAA